MPDNRDEFVCPVCGRGVPVGAKACPDCGSDENTGWSQKTYLDGIDVDEDDYDDMVRREFGDETVRRSSHVPINRNATVAAVLLVLAAVGVTLSLVRSCAQ